jgi:hypothetical protein
MNFPSLWLALGLACLEIACCGGRAAELTKAQFSKAELDSFGYPTNAAQATELGRSDARRDLSNGVVRVPMYGLPVPSSGDYDRILKEKYQVGRLGLGGCMVSEGLVAYAEGYSEVGRKFIEQKHGTNFWNTVQAEAEKAFHARTAGAGAKGSSPHAYRIQKGDTLIKIARQHGVTVRQLAEANPGVDAARLRVDQPLQIPARPPR